MPVNMPTIKSIAVCTAVFIASHKPMKKFLKPSQLFHKYINPATSATIKAIIATIGLASNTALKALNNPTIF